MEVKEIQARANKIAVQQCDLGIALRTVAGLCTCFLLAFPNMVSNPRIELRFYLPRYAIEIQTHAKKQNYLQVQGPERST